MDPLPDPVTYVCGGRNEIVLDLAKFVDKGVQVKLTGGRQVSGTLKGYDQLLNLVLDEAVKFVRDHDDPLKTTDQTRRLGLISPDHDDPLKTIDQTRRLGLIV